MSKKKLARYFREAAGADDCEGLEDALAEGADLECKDMTGRTALHWAAGRARPNTTVLLLDKGARVRPADSQQTPLHLLAEAGHGHELVVHLVKAAPWCLIATDSFGQTALDKAKYARNKEMVAALEAEYENVKTYAAQGGQMNPLAARPTPERATNKETEFTSLLNTLGPDDTQV